MTDSHRSKIFICVLILGSISCGGGGGGDGETSVSSTDACSSIGLAKIANATQCSAGGTPAASPLARLRIFSADGSEGLCTGAVIDTNLVLSAAHCFLGDVVAVEVDTFAGTFSAVGVNTSSAFSVVPSPFFPDSDLYQNDIAVVAVGGEIGTAKTKLLASRSPQVGEEVVVAGYGEFSPGELDASIRAGNAIVTDVTTQHVFIAFEGNQSHPCEGDSGGPILVDVGGELAIAGVVSQSDPQVSADTICLPGDVTLYTNVQSPESQAFLATAAPEAGTL